MTGAGSLDGQTALVTGASGFIGSSLCRRLSELGAEVHGTTRMTRRDGGFCAKWWQSGLVDLDEVRQIVRTIKPDLIFHLASHVAGSRSAELVMPTFSGNLVTTVNLLGAATEIGCRRIVLTGSLEEPSPEADWPVPSSPYAAAKYAASTYARMFHNLYQTPVVILRLFMVYGPAQQDLKKLIPYVILSLLEGRVPQMSSGVRKVDWVYVDDVVNAYLAAATANAAEGHTFDIGSGTLIRVRDVVERLVEAVNPKVKPLFGSIPDRLYEQERVADVGRAAAVLGWRPTTNLDEGLGRTVDWYRNQFRSRAYTESRESSE